MKPRPSKERRPVSVPDRIITGSVSPDDIRAYLLTTAWRVSNVPECFERDGALVPSPTDDDCTQALQEIIEQIAQREGRSTGETLRAIEAQAQTQVSVGLASRLEQLAGEAWDVAARAGSVLTELQRVSQKVTEEEGEERQIFDRGTALLVDVIERLKAIAAYLDRRGRRGVGGGG